MDNEEAPAGAKAASAAADGLEQHLALLQELCGRQGAPNLLPGLPQPLSADYLQNLQLLAAHMNSLGVLQQPPQPAAGPSRQLPQQQSLPADEPEPAAPKAAEQLPGRNRRTFSGSGSTISQHTRDRIRTMISSKNKQKQRLFSTSSMGSASNVSGGGAASGAVSAAGSDADLFRDLSATANAVSSLQSAGVLASPFEQFGVPGPAGLAASSSSAQLSDFQLRKVNSEPNLKMRLRARLLNKGSSPVTAQPHPYNNVSAGGHHRPLQRCDSDSVSVAGDALLKAGLGRPGLPHAQSTSNLAGGGLVIPSPSLPNLCNNLEQLQQLDLNSMLQASFASFLSMPSLLKNSLYAPNASMLGGALPDGKAAGAAGPAGAARFDSGRNGAGQLHVGGYPSLLKQQLRDLVLRRKSLVREEPEEEQLMEVFQQRLSAISQQNAQLKTGLVYDAAMSKHACLCGENQNHVEHGGRVHSIWARLQERGLVDLCERVVIRKASLDLLRLVHSTTYVTFFAVSPTACLKLDASEMPLKRFVQLPCGGIGVDSDTYFNDANTQLAIRVSVGSLVELATQVVEGKLRNGFACIRPPGHHAESEQAMGFCFFNNVAITARYLQKTYANSCRRIAIVDWDVHHGNGTQLCFESDPHVLYISLHRHDNGNFFPGTGAVVDMGRDEGRGFTVNVPFSGDVMGDAEYLAAWRVVVQPLLDSFQPDFILVSAGFDGAKGHAQALGGYELTPKLFGFFTRSLMAYAEGKVVLALEGGYDLPSICDSAEECVKALCANGGDISELSADALEKVPNQAAQETIQKVVAIHKKSWPCLSAMHGINMSEVHWQTVSQGLQSLTVRA